MPIRPARDGCKGATRVPATAPIGADLHLRSLRMNVEEGSARTPITGLGDLNHRDVLGQEQDVGVMDLKRELMGRERETQLASLPSNCLPFPSAVTTPGWTRSGRGSREGR